MTSTRNTLKEKAEEEGLKITAKWSCEALNDTPRQTGHVIELINAWVERKEEAEKKKTEVTDK